MLSTFFASKAFKIGLGIAALVGVALIIRSTVGAINQWETSIKLEAYTSGVNATEARWQKASAKSALDARDRLATDALASNKSVASYLADLSSRAPQILRLKERTEVYAQNPDSDTICLDPVGVGLWQQSRDAAASSGGTASPAPAPASGVQGALPGPGPAAQAKRRHDVANAGHPKRAGG